MSHASLPSSCPSDEELTRFVDGSASGAEAAALEAHVDGCPTCHRVLAVFAQEGGEPSLGDVEAPGPHSAAAAEVLAALQELRPLLPGTKLGRFVLLDWVGEGAAGVVYAAYDPDLDRKVALKLMHPPSTSEREGARERVIEEARAMGKAASPHVVTVHDVGTFEGRVFIAMEFVEGTTLREWVRSARRSVTETLHVYAQAGRGLAAAHAAGLVHRDFKPSNVLLGDDGRVRVTDFGLAQSATAPSEAPGRMVSGTPAYMSPEQLLGGHVDARSDQFGFCVALYEALYGEPPFTVPLNKALATGAKTAVREPPASTKVSAWTRRCIVRGLEPDPKDRHASIGELLDALAHDPSVTRRRTRVLVLATLVVGLLVGAGGLAWHRAGAARREVCAHAGDRFAALWNEKEQATLASVFAAVGTPHASLVWPTVHAAIDRFGAAWVEDRTRTCQAVLAHAEPAAVASDEHVVCLDDRLLEVRALLDELATVKTIEGAYGGLFATASLPAISLCDGVQHGTRRAGAGADAARVEQVRQALARAHVLAAAEQVEEAAKAAAFATDTALAMGDQELLGQSLTKRGQLECALGRFTDAERLYFAALVAAERSGDDNRRGYALAGLVSVSGIGKHDLVAAREWRDEALAVLARTGADDDLDSFVHDNMGNVLWSLGKPAEAIDEARAAVAAGERLGDPFILGGMLLDLGVFQGAGADFAAATITFRRASAVWEKALGADHPKVLVAQNDLADALLEQRDLAAALPIVQRAVLLNVSSYDQQTFLDTEGEILVEMGRGDEAVALLGRPLPAPGRGTFGAASTELLALSGRSYLAANRPAEAQPFLERAVADTEDADPRYLNEARFALARTLTALGREPARARELAEDAARGFDELPYPSPLIVARKEEVRGWLATKRATGR